MSTDQRMATVKSWFSDSETVPPPRELDAMAIAKIISEAQAQWKPARTFSLKGSPHGTKHGGKP